MPSPFPLLPLLSLLLATAITAATAANLRTFRNCLPDTIPVHLPSSPTYVFLKSQSFLTTFAKPLAITRPSTEAQLVPIVKCANKAALRICPRSGGHSLIGASLCNGLLIDLQSLRTVKLQPANILYVQAGANQGEMLWTAWKANKRWFAAGVCPSVGAAGYVLGGGHGPYEGRLSITCDSLVSLRMVDRFGNFISVTRKKRPALFWAMCGAGGGQFGIVTSFRLRTAASKPFDRAVFFRFNWPQQRIGELMEKWQYYRQFKGDIWFRLEMYLAPGDSGMYGYGACYDVDSTKQCMSRLKKAEFFNVQGRKTVVLTKAKNALDVHAFFGPEGEWGRKRAPDLRKALIKQRNTSGGDADGRLYQSTFLSRRKNKLPSRAFWQKYADFCARPGRKSIPWIVCELNLFNNAIDKKRRNAFAHRGADIITHYIIGGGSKEDKRFVYFWMKKHLQPYTSGVYVNYPELLLGKSYARAYWGKSLPRLKRLKQAYDPKLFFMNPQPIPRK